jgi:hypothetical protein
MSNNRKPTLEELFPLPSGIKIHTRKFGVAPVSQPVLVPAVGFRYVFEDPEQGLHVVVTERDDGRLVGEATYRDAAGPERAVVSVAITSNRTEDSIRKTIQLNEPTEGGGCRGTADFGTRADAIARLGDQFVFVVFVRLAQATRRPMANEKLASKASAVVEVAPQPQPRKSRRPVVAVAAAVVLVAAVVAVLMFASRTDPQKPGKLPLVAHKSPDKTEVATTTRVLTNNFSWLSDDAVKTVRGSEGPTGLVEVRPARTFKLRAELTTQKTWGHLFIISSEKVTRVGQYERNTDGTLVVECPQFDWSGVPGYAILVLVLADSADSGTANDLPSWLTLDQYDEMQAACALSAPGGTLAAVRSTVSAALRSQDWHGSEEDILLLQAFRVIHD